MELHIGKKREIIRRVWLFMIVSFLVLEALPGEEGWRSVGANASSLPIVMTFDEEPAGHAPSGFTVAGNGGSVLIDNAVPGGGNHSMKITDTFNGTGGYGNGMAGNIGVEKVFTPLSEGILRFETAYKYEGANESPLFNNLYFQLLGTRSDSSQLVPVMDFGQQKVGAFRSAGGSQYNYPVPSWSYDLLPDAWYHVKVDADLDAGTYDLYYSSEHLASYSGYVIPEAVRVSPTTFALLDQPFYDAAVPPSAVVGIEGLRMYTGYNTGTWYFDSLSLQRIVHVSGRLTEDLGLPLAGAKVQAFAASDTSMTEPLDTYTTGADGSYTMGLPLHGSYVLRAEKNGYAASGATIGTTDQHISALDIQLVLDGDGGRYTIAGNVEDIISEQPLSAATITLYAENDWQYEHPIATIVTSAEGSFLFPDLINKRYMLRVEHEQYITMNSPVALYKKDYRGIAVRMSPKLPDTLVEMPLPPSVHPRLYVREDTLPALRRKLTEAPYQHYWDDIVQLSAGGKYSGYTSGATLEMESFAFEMGQAARYVRLVNRGSSTGRYWINVTEFEAYAHSLDPAYEWEKIVPSGASWSSASAQYPGHLAIDGSLSSESRWQANGDGEWLRLDLGSPQTVSAVGLATFRGDQFSQTFDIEVSLDGENWSFVHLQGYDDSPGYLPPPAVGKMNYSNALRRVIEGNAFRYVVDQEAGSGQKAVDMAISYLNSIVFSSQQQYHQIGDVIHMAALVYDWCYDLFTNEQRAFIVTKVKSLAAQMEIGYPEMRQGTIAGHGSENQLMKNLYAAGIAFYDEDPEIYQFAAGRLHQAYVPARDTLSMSGMHYQGDSYGPFRYSSELWTQWLYAGMGYGDFMRGDLQQRIPYFWMHTRRPDGQWLRDGDSYNAIHTSRDRRWQHVESHMLASGYYKQDPYLREEFLQQLASTASVEPLHAILFAELEPLQAAEARPLTAYFGYPQSVMIARTGWGQGKNSPSVVAEMKVDELFTGNHEHLDAGSFQIYYKGALALDSGIYEGTDGSYFSAHDKHYHKRSIAHNTMLVHDPNEPSANFGVGNNDGGQRWPNGSIEPSDLNTLLGRDYTVARTLHHGFGSDPATPAYSYLKGDISPAYSDKVKQHLRSFVFLNMGEADHPAALIVYDQIAAADPSHKKYWLLHSEKEPQIDGMRATIVQDENGYNGKLIVDTLLPTAAVLDKVGGPGHEFDVFGTNYATEPKTPYENNSIEGGKWRLQVSPAIEQEEDEFLHVMQVMDADGTATPLSSERIDSGSLVGAKLGNHAVLFSKAGHPLDGAVTFSVYGLGNGAGGASPQQLNYTVVDLAAGVWAIASGGSTQYGLVTEQSATLHFTGAAGEVTLTPVSGVITPSLSVEHATGVYSDNAAVTAVLTDEEGVPLAGEKVAFKVNGIAAGAAITDASGKAILSYSVTDRPQYIAVPGQAESEEDYAIEATYEGNVSRLLMNAESRGKLTIQKENVSLVNLQLDAPITNNQVQLSVQLADGDGAVGELGGVRLGWELQKLVSGSLEAVQLPTVWARLATDDSGTTSATLHLEEGTYFIRSVMTESAYYKPTASSFFILNMTSTGEGSMSHLTTSSQVRL